VNTVIGSSGFFPAGMVGVPPRSQFGSFTNSKPAGGAKFRMRTPKVESYKFSGWKNFQPATGACDRLVIRILHFWLDQRWGEAQGGENPRVQLVENRGSGQSCKWRELLGRCIFGTKETE